MKFFETSKYFSLKKSTYINLRWIAIVGQLITINLIYFIFNFKFDLILENSIILIGILSNLYLIYINKNTQLSDKTAFLFLLIDILQLSCLIYLTGGIANPFSIFLIIPTIFSSSSLSLRSNLSLVTITCLIIIFLTFFSILFVALLYMIFFISKFEYIRSRIESFFNPTGGTHNFQPDKAIEAITSGGFFGKGIGEGTLKNRVPEAHTDYIISVISEEFGVVIIISLLIIFLFFVYYVFKKLYSEKNEKIKLILVGSITLILLQTLIHLGVNIRLFPTTGMTLPYLSYGGSSIIGVSILSGIILNLTKRKVS